jgi:glycosyltransferase involved in cell wall biosynthesis
MNATSPFRPCALIPTFDNPRTIARVVAEVRGHLPDVLIVDDGSHEPARRALDELECAGAARVTHRQANGGKGAAVKTGLRVARERGFTHVVQIDADGQHEPADVPKFVALAAARPEAVVLAHPLFDDSTPRGRRAAHALTNFWTRVETAGPVITDPQCGFRVYPIEATIAAEPKADRMAFDIEIAVRLVWAGVPVINVPTRVRYLPVEDGAVSHFRPVRDNLAISWMHIRLVCGSLPWRLRRARERTR